MKISLVTISIIIALQATSLIYGSHQRYVFHNTLNQLIELTQPLKTNYGITILCNCFCMHQQIRIIAISFMYASALLLFTGDAVWPSFFAQIFWIVFQSYLCTDQSLSNIRNFAIQILILWVIGSNLQCCGCKSNLKPDSIENTTASKDVKKIEQGKKAESANGTNKNNNAQAAGVANQNKKNTKQGKNKQ